MSEKTLAQAIREEYDHKSRRFLHWKARAMSPMSMDEAELAGIGHPFEIGPPVRAK